MNRKALELAISTLILIILGVLILIAVIYAVTDGFKNFNSTTEPFTDAARETAIKTACQDACSNQLKFTYCCEKYTIDDEEIKCNDSRLELYCQLDCSTYNCEE